tara:strand:+ start:738 stop:968 length:231 start_codon:yes stop_codon:yes gene_type:complete
MEMSKEKYDELMRRFSQELYDVGVTSDLTGLVKDQSSRIPNSVSITQSVETDRFSYRHDGYMIEAKRAVTLTLKKC